MASVAIKTGGTVLNAVAFIGRNYLAHFLLGDDPKSALEEKRLDKALETYQAAYAKNQIQRGKLLERKQRTGKTKVH